MRINNKKIKKIIFSSSILLILFIILFADLLVYAENESTEKQSPFENDVPRNVLIELFINEGCTICPKAAFCLEEIVWGQEPGRVILVESHIWGDGYDTPETNARYNWYAGEGQKGTPDTFFNGLSERVQGLCCDCGDIDENISAYQNIIKEQLARSAQIDIHATMGIYGGKIIIEGDYINKSHSLLNNLSLSGIIYHEGDRSEHFYLVRDIFENQDICQLAPLEERNFSFISQLDLTGLEENELSRYFGVVFIQDKLSKEVLQSFLIQ